MNAGTSVLSTHLACHFGKAMCRGKISSLMHISATNFSTLHTLPNWLILFVPCNVKEKCCRLKSLWMTLHVYCTGRISREETEGADPLVSCRGAIAKANLKAACFHSASPFWRHTDADPAFDLLQLNVFSRQLCFQIELFAS